MTLVLVSSLREGKMASTLVRDIIGKCPGCGGPLIKAVDTEDRVWAKCTSCGAQIPIEMSAKLKSGK